MKVEYTGLRVDVIKVKSMRYNYVYPSNYCIHASGQFNLMFGYSEANIALGISPTIILLTKKTL